MRVIHNSDSHSRFLPLPPGDLIIHSGDFCPNASRGNRHIEPKYQTEWLTRHVEVIKKWLGGRTLLICSGNHDFVNIAEILSDLGLDVIDLNNKFVNHMGLNFYGFPYIPFIGGEWNFELRNQEMSDQIDLMTQKLLEQEPLDILVAHAPIHGILDTYLEDNLGNAVLANKIYYKQFKLPKYYLHGHIHEAHGIKLFENTLVSNAATTINIIEI